MIRIKEQELKENKDIRKVEFEKQFYFSVEDVAKFLNEDLSDVETVNLAGIIYATTENINKGRKREELSDFNKKLLQAKHYKK